MFEKGDDVIVNYDDYKHRGVVHSHAHGWVMATIEIDPEADYGSVTDRLSPHTTVCVAEQKVRKIEQLGKDRGRLLETPEDGERQ